MSFTDQEIAFMASQGLGRLATVDPDGQPDVVPVAVEYDEERFWVGGPGGVVRTRKFRNVAAGSALVSIVFDDLPSMEPFVARGMRVYGVAEQPFERVGMVGPGIYMRITPTVSWSWNLAGEPVGDEWYPAVRREHRIT
ncbi:PPOX class F420-dependent oxidoreductase [Actinomycetospora sp. C-140]